MTTNELYENTNDFVDVTEKIPLKRAIPLSFQHLFAMFGSSVLVPLIFKIDPTTVLFFNGIGTLLYAFLTKKKIPAYLGSSFAFISPVLLLYSQGYNFETIQGGFVAAGVVFSIIAIIVGYTGIGWVDKLFPPAAMGAIITIIGLELASTAADMAGFPVGGSNTQTLNVSWVIVSSITLVTVILCNVLLRGFLKLIPILIGVVVGYIVSLSMGLIDFSTVSNASFFLLPNIKVAHFDINAILTILPATFVVIAEHVGHLKVTSSIVGKDLTKDPGLHRSLLGDGLSTIISGMFGSVPTTTYGENIGVLALTKVYSVYVICGAGLISIILGFSGKMSAIISTIPTPVIGGVSLLLFGSIATSGLRTFIEGKVDFSKSRNLILTSIIFVIGLSGIKLTFGSTEIKGMGLATLVAMVLSISFMIFDKLGIMNEKE
ncbi:uracil permease [Clostridium saccharoperbutylacetonicum]|uniref:Uracil permease UraA n=1 Tax=Clostridium saccharoperbutylacetonicum N1-4(HMT) TaxID=931276 RepID=M1MJP8_9CLOT|nr:uracil permease [Clostridium saccharoperbutylacetonicum]AGF56538.1 uracil permease UraA [Clostridium saccharoperbutylacetonicum N1-4(HMT)]NRT62711.1 uracil permease [Clostridium saccharoperbutylacetonicum]NSB26062.1 uracil permease [Clostridium saccharoperbutylacetonicum]NSB45417.1 uracil permease [Clostridium saccharoperbutylacetonicum]